MKIRLLALLGISSLLIVACGKSFKVNSEPVAAVAAIDKNHNPLEKLKDIEDVGQFYQVKNRARSENQKLKSITLNKHEYKVERERLNFSNVAYDFKENLMILRGELKLNSLNEKFELSGKVSNGIVDLVVTDSKSIFADKLKARATCYDSTVKDEETVCREFFIDFYFFDQGTFYTDQLIPKSTAAVEGKNPKETPVSPKDNSTPKDSSVIVESEPEEVTEEGSGYFIGQTNQDILELYPKLSEVPPVTESPTTAPPTSPKTPPLKPPQGSLPPGSSVSPKKPPAVGKIGRPVNQAVGGVSSKQGVNGLESGSLRNASSLLEVFNRLGRTSGFQILRPDHDKYYGTWDMIQLIQRMGEWVRDNIPGQTLGIGNITSKFGGKQEGQVSHQNGLDVDIAYFTPTVAKMLSVVNLKSNNLDSELLLDDQWKLFKQLMGTEMVNIIIVDPVIKQALCQRSVLLGEINNPDDNNLATRTLKRLYTDEGKREHANHFHLRIMCGSHNRACLQQNVADQPLGCEISTVKTSKL